MNNNRSIGTDMAGSSTRYLCNIYYRTGTDCNASMYFGFGTDTVGTDCSTDSYNRNTYYSGRNMRSGQQTNKPALFLA